MPPKPYAPKANKKNWELDKAPVMMDKRKATAYRFISEEVEQQSV